MTISEKVLAQESGDPSRELYAFSPEEIAGIRHALHDTANRSGRPAVSAALRTIADRIDEQEPTRLRPGTVFTDPIWPRTPEQAAFEDAIDR